MSEQKELSRRGLPAYRENPFIAPLLGMQTRKKRVTVDHNKAMIDLDTGEIEETVEICAVREVDREEFVKVYTNGLKDWFNLSLPAYRLVGVVMKQVQKAINGDVILMNADLAKVFFTETGQKPMSKSTYYRALQELLQKGFLAKHAESDSLFFINPAVFFNGDRVKFVKEYRLRKNKQINLFPSDPNQELTDAQKRWISEEKANEDDLQRQEAEAGE